MSTRKSQSSWRYIGERAAQSLLIFFIIITLNFIIFRVMPGDPRQALLGEGLSPELRIAIERRFGLDRPLLEQYWLYLVNLFQGDLGYSFSHFGEPVFKTIFDYRFINTFLLMGTSLIISIIIGILVGVFAAARRDTIVDTGSTITFLIAYALPVFWVGILILYYMGFLWQLIPIAGTITRGYNHINVIDYMFDYLHHMIGPLIVLTLSFIGGFYLIMRDSVLDVFTQDYILAAKAKGLKERTILYGHAMRNAMLPMVSVIAVNMPYLISGAMMTEYVFSWAGLGLLTYNSVLSVDYPVLQGIFLFLAAITIISNFAADILYLYLDPRIRY
ncbi:ABC transporter permease [Candidatus Thorarchaeota archaeon]|nr:MAG: ABC transporter permease [Candidatus Thorarchaeota archaeon]